MGTVHRSFMAWKRSQNLSSLSNISLTNNVSLIFMYMRKRKEKKKWGWEDLGAEYNDGVLGAERDETRGAPGDVVDDSVAACSYEHSVHFYFTTKIITHFNVISNFQRETERESLSFLAVAEGGLSVKVLIFLVLLR